MQTEMMFPDFRAREPYEFIKKVFAVSGAKNDALAVYDSWTLDDVNDFGFNAGFVISYVTERLKFIGVIPHQALIESCLYACFIIDRSMSTAQIKRQIDFSVLTAVYDDYLVFHPDKLGDLMTDLFAGQQKHNINKYYHQVQEDCLHTLQTNFVRNEFQRFWTAVPEAYFRTVRDKPVVDSITALHNIKRPVTFCDVTSLLLVDEQELQELDVKKMSVFYKLLDITYYLVMLINDFASYEKEQSNGEYDNPILFCESQGKSRAVSFREVVACWEQYNKELSFVAGNKTMPQTGRRLFNFIRGNVLFSKYTVRYRVLKYDLTLDIT